MSDAGQTPAPPPPESASAVPGVALTVRAFGVPIRLHFTFILLVVFLIAFGVGVQQTAWASALYVLALFGSVLLHELGHALVARTYGIRTLEIIMFPIGGLARLERMPKPAEEFWIAVAGPAVNLAIAGILLGWLAMTQGAVGPPDLSTPTDVNLPHRIALGNLVLAFFNLLPAFPMDGGRILRALLARRRSEAEATQIAARAGRIMAVLMGLYGLLSMNFMLVFIAFFVYLGAVQENAAVQGRTLTEGVPVRAAMVSDFRTLAHGDTLRDAANLLLATSQQDFPVLLGNQVTGLLTRHSLLRGLAVEGPDAYVASIMDRSFPVVRPDDDLSQALQQVFQTGCALVMENDRLIGLLTRDNCAEFLILRRFGHEVAAGARG